MFRFACVLAVLSCVSAFMPASYVRSSSAVSMAAEGMSKSLPFCKKPKNLDGMIVRKPFQSNDVNRTCLPSLTSSSQYPNMRRISFTGKRRIWSHRILRLLRREIPEGGWVEARSRIYACRRRLAHNGNKESRSIAFAWSVYSGHSFNFRKTTF